MAALVNTNSLANGLFFYLYFFPNELLFFKLTFFIAAGTIQHKNCTHTSYLAICCLGLDHFNDHHFYPFRVYDLYALSKKKGFLHCQNTKE